MFDRPHPNVLARICCGGICFRAQSSPPTLTLQRCSYWLMLCAMPCHAMHKRDACLTWEAPRATPSGQRRADLSLVARMKSDHSRRCFFCMFCLVVVYKRRAQLYRLQ